MIVVEEEVVWNIVLPQILSKLYGALEVTVVATTDCAVDYAWTLFAEV